MFPENLSSIFWSYHSVVILCIIYSTSPFYFPISIHCGENYPFADHCGLCVLAMQWLLHVDYTSLSSDFPYCQCIPWPVSFLTSVFLHGITFLLGHLFLFPGLCSLLASHSASCFLFEEQFSVYSRNKWYFPSLVNCWVYLPVIPGITYPVLHISPYSFWY